MAGLCPDLRWLESEVFGILNESFHESKGIELAEAVKDLPDPMEEPVNATGPSPDDLLSKMADQAISQLIENTEKGIAPSPLPNQVATSEASPSINESPPALATEADEKRAMDQILSSGESSELDQKDAPASAEQQKSDPPKPEESEAAKDVQSQLDNVLSELKSDPPPPPSPEPQPLVTQQTNTQEYAPESREDIKALFEPAAAPVKHRKPAPEFLVKPLEWMNVPFNSLPDTIRDTLGQIGIVTMINALAVLLYIILFRR